jgi:hypothetical protein
MGNQEYTSATSDTVHVEWVLLNSTDDIDFIISAKKAGSDAQCRSYGNNGPPRLKARWSTNACHMIAAVDNLLATKTSRSG